MQNTRRTFQLITNVDNEDEYVVTDDDDEEDDDDKMSNVVSNLTSRASENMHKPK